MRSYLRYDEEAHQLKLVLTDLWDGQHERTEYPLAGQTARGRELDGARVTGNGYAEPYRAVTGTGIMQRRVQFDTVPGYRAQTVKTPCRRLASKSGRAKCALCAEESASLYQLS
jgi:hypothetical protein